MEAEVSLRVIKPETHDAKSFIFDKPSELDFTAGQFIRWYVDHLNADDRGEVRPFSISSSPTEDFLMFTTKFAEPGSTFKKTLLSLPPGAKVRIRGPFGHFILPEDTSQPIVFLGGGVGITPFRGMIKFATDTKLSTQLTLLYANKTPADIIFRAEFDGWQKENPNFKLVYTVDTPDEGWAGEVGYLTEDIIRRHVPDVLKPLYYICGPEGMINAYKQVLQRLDISEEKIITENFSGY